MSIIYKFIWAVVLIATSVIIIRLAPDAFVNGKPHEYLFMPFVMAIFALLIELLLLIKQSRGDHIPFFDNPFAHSKHTITKTYSGVGGPISISQDVPVPPRSRLGVITTIGVLVFGGMISIAFGLYVAPYYSIMAIFIVPIIVVVVFTIFIAAAKISDPISQIIVIYFEVFLLEAVAFLFFGMKQLSLLVVICGVVILGIGSYYVLRGKSQGNNLLFKKPLQYLGIVTIGIIIIFGLYGRLVHLHFSNELTPQEFIENKKVNAPGVNSVDIEKAKSISKKQQPIDQAMDAYNAQVADILPLFDGENGYYGNFNAIIESFVNGDDTQLLQHVVWSREKIDRIIKSLEQISPPSEHSITQLYQSRLERLKNIVGYLRKFEEEQSAQATISVVSSALLDLGFMEEDRHALYYSLSTTHIDNKELIPRSSFYLRYREYQMRDDDNDGKTNGADEDDDGDGISDVRDPDYIIANLYQKRAQAEQLVEILKDEVANAQNQESPEGRIYLETRENEFENARADESWKVYGNEYVTFRSPNNNLGIKDESTDQSSDDYHWKFIHLLGPFSQDYSPDIPERKAVKVPKSEYKREHILITKTFALPDKIISFQEKRYTTYDTINPTQAEIFIDIYNRDLRYKAAIHMEFDDLAFYEQYIKTLFSIIKSVTFADITYHNEEWTYIYRGMSSDRHENFFDSLESCTARSGTSHSYCVKGCPKELLMEGAKGFSYLENSCESFEEINRP